MFVIGAGELMQGLFDICVTPIFEFSFLTSFYQPCVYCICSSLCVEMLLADHNLCLQS